MEVLKAHRQRTAKLRNVLDELIALHLDLCEQRTAFWMAEAVPWAERKAVQDPFSEKISALASQVDLLRETTFPDLAGHSDVGSEALVGSLPDLLKLPPPSPRPTPEMVPAGA